MVTQKEIFESVKHVTDTSDSDWTIAREDTKKRYEDGLVLVKGGNMAGFGQLLYARGFYPDDPSDCSTKVQNELLGMPEESLDEATQIGINLVKNTAESS